MELIKNTIKVGNSAGVLLPREYLNTSVKITLEPLNLEEDIFKILLRKNLLKDTKGIYLVGSYARKENTFESDVDVLVVTSKTNRRIVEGKYELILVSEENLKKQLEINIFPLLFMIKESLPLLNAELLDAYKDFQPTKKNVAWHIETTKSAMNIVEESINLSREMGTMEDEASSYSLILRLRGIYLLDCLFSNKPWKNSGLKKLIMKVSGSLRAYEGYQNVKNNRKIKNTLNLVEAEKLKKYVLQRLKIQEKLLKNEKEKK